MRRARLNIRHLSALGASVLATAPWALGQSGLFTGQRSGLGQTSQVTVHGTLEHASAAPGGSTTLAIVFDIAEGWHTYWKNPGDSGAPIHLSFDAPEGVTIGETQWPAPHRHLYNGGTALDYTYEERAVLLVPISIADDAPIGEGLTLRVEVEYLVCKEACIPGSASFETTIEVASGVGASTGNEALFAEARARVPRPASDAQADGIVTQWAGMTLALSAPGAAGVWFYPLAPDLPAPEDAIRDGEGEGDTLTIVYPLDIKNAQSVEGVFEASIRGEKRVYTIATAPPKSR